MNTPTIIDDILSLKMGTTGILFKLEETVSLDFTIDNLDDKRRETYIKKMERGIHTLEKFVKEFNNQDFTNFVVRFTDFLKDDLKQQLYYEDLSDNLREILFNNIKSNTERLRNENHELDKSFITKIYKK